jgi:3-oxoacyl-[acyl-carrier-protein] synthase II
LRSLANAGVGLISPEIGARGPSNNFVQSDTASALAIEAACDDLAAGRCDLAVAVGYDSLVGVSTYLAFEREGLLSPSPPEEACRPFDRRRDGVALGEGAGALVLERREDAERRGAPMVGEIAGVDNALDISNSLEPFELDPFIRMIRSQAELLGGVDMVIAHGLGTRAADCREGKLLSQVFDRSVPVTALKGSTGYLGAATGVVETGLGLLSLRERLVPAITRCSKPDEEIPLDLVTGAPRRLSAERPSALFLSWSLAGQCSVLAARAVEC